MAGLLHKTTGLIGLTFVICRHKTLQTLPVLSLKILSASHKMSELSACHKHTEAGPQDKDWWKKAKSIYEFSADDIDGNKVSMEKYKGHVCVIVNVATKCGFTDKSYEQLQAIYDELGAAKGLRILGFPCNQFSSQEPGTNAEIKEFAKSKFGVTFDMFSKIDVNGDGAHPLFKYLKFKQGGTFGDFIKWNFSKFIVDKQGQPVERYAPTVEPFVLKKDLDKYW